MSSRRLAPGQARVTSSAHSLAQMVLRIFRRRRFQSPATSIVALALLAGAALMPATARAQVLLETNAGGNTVGAFTTSGGEINRFFISTGLNVPTGIALSGTDLFIASFGNTQNNGKIGWFTTSGMTVNSSLVTGLFGPFGLAIAGGNLFVVNNNNGTVGEYTLAGTPVNPAL